MIRIMTRIDYSQLEVALYEELLLKYSNIVKDKDVIVKPNLAFKCDLACTRWEVMHPILSFIELQARTYSIVESNVFGNVTPQTVAKSVGYPDWVIDKITNLSETPNVLRGKVLINVPKLKAHDLHFKYTCARKNLLGLINSPEERFKLHRGDIDGFIDRLNRQYPSSLVVVDAIEVMEGKGCPLRGKPKQLGNVIVGSDAFEVDKWVEDNLISTGVIETHYSHRSEWLVKQAGRTRLTSRIYSNLVKVREQMAQSV